MDSNNGSIKYSVSLDDSKMSSDANHVIDTFSKIGQTAEQEGSRIDTAFSAAAANIGKAFAAIGIAGTLQELGKKILVVRGDFEKLEVAFEVMLGSASKANELMKQLTYTAATTPFDLQGVADGAKQLLAYGVSADEVNDTLVRLGNIASGLSIPLNDLVMLYGTTMTQGRLFTQDLRQFMGRGIPLADELAKQFGVTKDKVADLVTAGKVGFPQVKKAIEDLTNAGGKFAGLMEKQSHTVAGKISNIGDAIDSMFNKIGKQNEGVINGALSAVSYLIENYETLGKVLVTLVTTYGTYKAALIAIAAIQKSQAIYENIQLMMMFRKELGLATAAQQAFNITAKANPYALIASGIALVVTSLSMFSDSTEEATNKEDTMNQIREQAAEKMAEEKTRIEILVAAARNEKLSLDQRKVAIDKLNKQIPNYNAHLGATTQKYYENKDALDAYLQSLQKMYELEGAKDLLKDLGKKIAKNTVDLKKAEKDLRDATQKDNEISANTGGVYAYTLSNQAEERVKQLRKERAELQSEQKAVNSVYGQALQEQATGGKRKKTKTTTYQDDVKQAKKKWEKKKKELKALLKDVHATSAQVKQAREDVNQAEKDIKDLTGVDPTEAATTATRQAKQAKTEAKKEYKTEVQTRKETAEYKETQREVAQEKEKQAAQLELEIRQAQLSAQEDSTQKEIDQIKLDRDKKIAEIEDEYKQIKEKKIQQAKAVWDANPKHDETPFKLNENDPAYAYTEDEKTLRQTKIDAANKEYNDKMHDLEQQRLQYLYDYLKAYGTLQEQKYAIAKEYDEKIAKSHDEWQKKSLEQEKKNAVADADARNLSTRIDWSGTFGNVGKVLKDIAVETLKQVEDYMKTDEFKGLGADQKKTYSELRTKLQQETGENSVSPFNFKIWGTIEQQVKAYQQSVKNLLDAQKKHTDAVEKLEKADNDYKNATDDAAKAIAKTAVDAAKADVEKTGKDQTDAQTKADKAKSDLTDSTNAAAQGIQNFSNYLSEMTNGSLYGFANGITKLITSLTKGSEGFGKSIEELGGKIGGIIGAILQIIDALGDDPKQFINDLFEKITNTVETILSQLPSLVTNIVHDAGNLVMGVVEGVGSMFGLKSGWINGSNAKEVKEITEKLTTSNTRLQNSIDRLKDSIDKNGGTQAVKDYEQAYKDEQALIKNTMQILQAQMSYHSNHHSNAHYWNLNDEDYAAINETLTEYLRNNPTAQTTKNSVYSLSDIYSLTPEQMQAIADHNVDIWTKMLDAGKYDKSEYWENYIELAGKLEELTEQINENLTQVSFDSLKSDFVDDIMDMSKTASDFSKDFSQMIAKSWTNAAVSNLMQKDLQNFYDDWSARMKDTDGLTAQDIAELKKQYDTLVNNAISIRDDMTQITGYTGDDSSSQEASSGAWQSMSEDTGEELNGRFTAIQSTTVMIYEQIKQNAASIATISETAGDNYSVLSEMNNLVLTCSEYLQRIVANTNVIPAMSKLVEKIKINTDKL